MEIHQNHDYILEGLLFLYNIWGPPGSGDISSIYFTKYSDFNEYFRNCPLQLQIIQFD